MLVGFAILLYPSFSDYWNSFHQSRAIMSYMEEVANMDTSEYDAWIESAQRYNQEITDNGPNWMPTEEDTEKYNAELAYGSNGSMGYIIIDKINCMLSLYHGTSEAVLQTGIGHVEGSSLPVGSSSWDSKEGKLIDPNEGVHIVVSGHRGLPSAKLFSDLDKLVEGDIFVINILNETLTFQVDQIRVVEPTDLSNVRIIKGRDYCTLVTCTPYGINTHRLLVRGHRVANAQGDVKVVADALQIRPVYIVPFIAVPVLLILILLMLIDTGISSRQKKRIRKLHAMIEEREEKR
ncbi:MAG: class C sortase [Dehalococcoidales bacterium]|nr:class C sortase [Dehalococcoidales bacterium]